MTMKTWKKVFAATLLPLAFLSAGPANAQLKSVDGGAAATDSHGLMWANTVGVDLTWSATGAAGSAQAWIGGLNASDYGGYNNWTLATGNGSAAANSVSNQLGELFDTDCGNSSGKATVLNKSGKSCTALSAVGNALGSFNNGIEPGAMFFSSSLYGNSPCCNIYNTAWWVYSSPSSQQGAFTADSNFGFLVGQGDALAVRAAPEINADAAMAALTLLLGAIAIFRDRLRLAHFNVGT